LTERAVRARIEKLVREKVIRKFTIETSPVGVEGIVLIDTQTGRASFLGVVSQNEFSGLASMAYP
jgi:DNA-binding Lrp family transcriptional regulator